jgi:hypothetical protein
MRGRVVALAAAGAGIAVGLTMTLIMERAHAQGAKAAAPADDCWSGPASGGAACEHVFKDGTKCVLYVRPSPVNTTASLAAMECKIT